MRTIAGFLFVLAISACANGEPTPITARYADNGVSVDIAVTIDDDGAGIVVATFTPDNDGWHLYDTTMSLEGIEGFGRPTRLEIASGASSTGPTTADQVSRSLTIASLGVSVPVYPDGPVTLRTPFVSTDESLDLRLTYMSCGTDGGCTIPVVDRSVQVDLTTANRN